MRSGREGDRPYWSASRKLKIPHLYPLTPAIDPPPTLINQALIWRLGADRMTNKDIIDQFLKLNLFSKFWKSIGRTTKANKSDGVVKKRPRNENYYLSNQVDQSVKVNVIYLSRFLKWRDSSICSKYQISIETFKKIIQEFNDSYKKLPTEIKLKIVLASKK